MYGASANSYAAQGNATRNELLLQSLLSVPGSSNYTSMVPPVTSTRSIGGYGGAVDNAAAARIALQGVATNGADLSKSGVPSKWRDWERRIRDEHPALMAQAIIDSAKGILGGSF